jgi:hypothetical protein
MSLLLKAVLWSLFSSVFQRFVLGQDKNGRPSFPKIALSQYGLFQRRLGCANVLDH